MADLSQIKPKSIFWFVTTLFLTIALLGGIFAAFGNILLLFVTRSFEPSSFLYSILFFIVSVTAYLGALKISVDYVIKNGLLGKKEFKQILLIILFMNAALYLYIDGASPDYVSALGTSVLFVLLYVGGVHFFDKKRLDVMRARGYEEKDIPHLEIFSKSDFIIFLFLLGIMAIFLYLANQISLVDIGTRFIDSQRELSQQNVGDNQNRNEMNSWVMYRNEEYGFELQYPPHLSFLNLSNPGFSNEEEERLVSIYKSKDPDAFEFIVHDKNYMPPDGAMGAEVRSGYQLVYFSFRNYSPAVLDELELLEAKLDEKAVSMGMDAEDVLPRKEIIGSYEMIYNEERGAAGPYPNIYFDSAEYFVHAESWQADLMKDILSTLRFFAPQKIIDTSHPGIYRNSEYRFEMRLPFKWVAEEANDGVAELIFHYKDASPYNNLVVKVYLKDFSEEKILTLEDLKIIEEKAFFAAHPDSKTYKSSIEHIGGFDVLIQRGMPGFLDGGYTMHVHLGGGKFLLFAGNQDELTEIMFRSIKKIY